MAVLMAVETAEKSGVAGDRGARLERGYEAHPCGCARHGYRGTRAVVVWHRDGDAVPLRMTSRKARAGDDCDAVRVDCLRKMRLAREPTAKVTSAPMRTYQVKATWGMATGCTA